MALSRVEERPRLPAPEGWATCRNCGCWEYDACWDEEMGACWWVDEELCSHCDGKGGAAGGGGRVPPIPDVPDVSAGTGITG